MPTDNVSLWESVERTDPAHVKPITGKSYSGTSPRPHWLVKRATEAFGPCGIGWGFSILKSEFIPSDDGIMHFAMVRVWYKWKGERGEVEHVGGTPFSGKRKNGQSFADEDAPKKSVTDALIKALSLIGFAGDIFLGRWDDNKYVAELRTEFQAAQEQSSAKRYLDEGTQFIAQCEIADELRTWWRNEEKARNAILNKIEAAKLMQACKERIAAIGTNPGIAEAHDAVAPPLAADAPRQETVIDTSRLQGEEVGNDAESKYASTPAASPKLVRGYIR